MPTSKLILFKTLWTRTNKTSWRLLQLLLPNPRWRLLSWRTWQQRGSTVNLKQFPPVSSYEGPRRNTKLTFLQVLASLVPVVSHQRHTYTRREVSFFGADYVELKSKITGPSLQKQIRIVHWLQSSFKQSYGPRKHSLKMAAPKTSLSTSPFEARKSTKVKEKVGTKIRVIQKSKNRSSHDPRVYTT